MRRLKRGLMVGGAVLALTVGGAAAGQEHPAARQQAEAQSTAPAEGGVTDGPGLTAPETRARELAPPLPPAGFGSPGDAILAGKLILEVRGRYEYVDQKRTAVLTEAAKSATVRTRLGWETGDWHGLKGLIEFEDVRHVGPEHFQVQVPGAAGAPLNGAPKARYPIVNDPDVTELNRLQLTWTPNSAVQATIGRQRINFDDQRFVGGVAWRQDEQTFDALRLDGAWGRFKATYAYVTHINRILGELRDWDSDSHLLNVTWSPAEQLRLQGFAYVLDFGNSAANSSVTKGVKASGKVRAGQLMVAYNATWANQGEYRGNTPNYSLDYLGGDVAATFDIWTAKASYETLEGSGTRGFTTPLATNHAFNGWSDAFVQPLGGNKGFVDGLEDFNLSLAVRPRWRWPHLSNIDLILRRHDFSAERTGAHLGHEWNAQVQAVINPRLSAALKYADFERDDSRVTAGQAAPPASRTKVWFTLEYKL